MSRVRTTVKKVGKLIGQARSRLSTDEIFDMCQACGSIPLGNHGFLKHVLPAPINILEKPFLVPSGGHLFYHFMINYASWFTWEIWKAHKRENGLTAPQTPFSEERWEAIRNKEGGAFHGFVLSVTRNVVKQARKQLFFTTFAARFHGLSRQGCELLAGFGWMMKARHYDSQETKAVSRAMAETRFDVCVNTCTFLNLNPLPLHSPQTDPGRRRPCDLAGQLQQTSQQKPPNS